VVAAPNTYSPAMAEAKLTITRSDDGEYHWVFVDPDGEPLPINVGSGLGLRTTADRPLLHKAVQAGLKLLYERQQAAARDAAAS
jgi:hypothetical protein